MAALPITRSAARPPVPATRSRSPPAPIGTGIGVDVDATAGTGNEIRFNAIFSNTGLGIDLGGDGVTLDNSVPHTGPNDHQNFPVITSVVERGGHNDRHRQLEQHSQHNIRDRLLHAVVDERVGLRRGAVRSGLDDAHDQPDGQRQLLLPVPDPRRAERSS